MRLSRVPVCENCWNRLAPESGVLCARCGEGLGIVSFSGEVDLPSDQLCQPCRLAPPAFERAVAYGAYSGTLRELIHRLKYNSMLPISDRLGILLTQAVLKIEAATAAQELLVVPVPMHAAKLRARGFNHSELLAHAALRALRSVRPGWTLQLSTGLLERKRSTQSQAGLSPHQRRANLRGAFFVPAPEKLTGRRVLLIDDIYTTGATARACSQVLRRAGAASVWVATVARPQRESFAVPQFDPVELPMREDVAFWGRDGKPAPLTAQAPKTFWGKNVFGKSHGPRS